MFKPPVSIEIKERYINSAIIGLWRMGNNESVISNVLGVSLAVVFNTIKTYKEIKGESNSDVSG